MKIEKISNRLLIGITAAIVAAAYWQSVSFPLLQDDWNRILSFNGAEPLQRLKEIFSSEHKLLFRPLADGFLYLLFLVFGQNPVPYHLLALTIHVANALLAGVIVSAVAKDRFVGILTTMVYAAAVAVHLDSLAWAVGFNDLLGAFFFFLSLVLFIRQKTIPSAVAYFLGCLVKEAVVLLPALLFLFVLLTTSGEGWRKRFAAVAGEWKRAVPFAVAAAFVFVLRGARGGSPFDLPSSHPYVLAVGGHVFSNLQTYLYWMVQAFLPVFDAKTAIIAVAAFLYCASACVVVVRIRRAEQPALSTLFLLGWIVVSFGPVLLLPNHAYRYYATYALPAFIGSSLFALDQVLSLAGVRRIVAGRIVAGISVFAVLASVVQANRMYREGLNQKTLAAGSNYLIRRAATVDIVRAGLREQLPVIPRNAVVAIGNADLWSFDKSSGPRVWYNDTTLRVYDIAELRAEGGKVYVVNPLEHQEDAYTGVAAAKIAVDTARLFLFRLSGEKLVRADFREMARRQE